MNTTADKSITAFHIDELGDDHITNLITSLTSDQLDPTKTVILYTSQTFRRSEFGKLKTALFAKLPLSTQQLFLTATCSSTIKSSLEELFGISFNSIHWPPAIEMTHRSVAFDMEYTSQPVTFVTKTIKPFLLPNLNNLPTKVIIYSNQRNKIMEFCEKIENFLDEDNELFHIDAIALVGTLTVAQKSQYIKEFLKEPTPDDDNAHYIQILCATSGVGNAGIDSPSIRAVYRIDFPPSILDICQEKGRAGRTPHATPNDFFYKLCFSLESFLVLYQRIHDKSTQTINPNYRKQQLSELIESAQFLISSNECYSKKFEKLLGNPCMSQQTLDNCMHCPYCRNENLFPPLNKDGIRVVLFNVFIDGDHVIKSVRNLKNVVDAIKRYPKAPQLLFHRPRASSVPGVDIKKALLILIARSIIKLSLDAENQVLFSLARSSQLESTLAMNDEAYWSSINIVHRN